MQRLLKTQELQVHKPPKPLVPDFLQGSPTYDDHHDVIRGGAYKGDLSCWHHRTGTMALHWVAPVFLSTTPHLHCNDDSKWRAAYQIMMNHKWQTEMMMMLADMYPVKSHTFLEHSLSQAFLISVNISYKHRYCYDWYLKTTISMMTTCRPDKLSVGVCWSRRHLIPGKCTQCSLIIMIMIMILVWTVMMRMTRNLPWIVLLKNALQASHEETP